MTLTEWQTAKEPRNKGKLVGQKPLLKVKDKTDFAPAAKVPGSEPAMDNRLRDVPK